MSVKRFVIIGNGPAANHAAEVLREKSAESRITIFSKDPFRSYRADLTTGFYRRAYYRRRFVQQIVCPL